MTDREPTSAAGEAVSFRDLFGPGVAPITLAVMASTVMNAFEGLAVATVLPDIADDLGNVESIAWVVTAFLLPSAVIGVAAGSLVDSWGARRTYRLGVGGFFVASVAAALAPTFWSLVAIRVLQGASSGVVISAALSSIGLVVPQRLRPRALAAASTVWGVVGVGGPAISAVINALTDWRGVFWAILPMATVAAIAGWSAMPGPVDAVPVGNGGGADSDSDSDSDTDTDSDAGGPARRLDLVGLALLGLMTTALTLGLSQVRVESLVALAGAVAVAGGLWLWLTRTDHPLFDPRRTFAGPFRLANLAPMGAMMAVPGINAYVTLYARVAGGASGVAAALGLLGVTLGWTTGANIASRVLDTWSEVRVVRVGYLLMLTGLSTVGLTAGWVVLPVVYAGLFVAGLGVGSTTNASFLLLQRSAVESEMGRASSVHQYLRAVGVTLGTAAMGAAIFATVDRLAGGAEVIRDALADPDQVVDSTSADALAAGMANAAWFGAAVVGVLAINVFSYRDDPGHL